MNDDELKLLLRPFAKAIGRRFRDLRKAKEFDSYENFAHEYDLPRMQYWRIETGETIPTLATLYKLLRIHNLAFSEFFASVEEDMKNQEKQV